ncbi:MAG: acyl-ACP--UDP-N-acetylglucosamine O-acyltransferase [candidate division WOR-3 bacterium]|nr:acyl-ACP--UDP-N-acetylglucosamine O-acyltransferase [candidate division WOR-3 bacterium]
MIAESALIHKSAILGKGISVGPFSIISAKSKIGDQVKIGPYVFVDQNVEIGDGCKIGPGVIIGTIPFDVNYKGEVSKVKIGKRNIIGEYTTIHRATGKNKVTLIGDDNFIMAYVHIAHNGKIGNNTVITNGSQLAGYVEIEDFANIGGMVGIHQHVRVGRYSMIGACSYLSKDLPPFLIGQGNPFEVRGLNKVGLRRNKFSQQRITLLNKAYRFIYRSKLNLSQAITKIKKDLPRTDDLEIFLDFIHCSERGIELNL